MQSPGDQRGEDARPEVWYTVVLVVNVVFLLIFFRLEARSRGLRERLRRQRRAFTSMLFRTSDVPRQQFEPEYAEAVQQYAQLGTWTVLMVWLALRPWILFRMVAGMWNDDLQLRWTAGAPIFHFVDFALGALILLFTVYPSLHKVRRGAVSYATAVLFLFAFSLPGVGLDTKGEVVMAHSATMTAMTVLAPLGGPAFSTLAAILYNLLGLWSFTATAGEFEVSTLQYGYRRLGLDLVVMLMAGYGSILFVASSVRETVQRKAVVAESTAISSLLELVCDAVVEVNGAGCITSHGRSLASLLLWSEYPGLEGTELQGLLHGHGDRERLAVFLEQAGTKKGRFRLRDAVSKPVCMEIFKVTIDSGVGLPEKHLLGIKEESESTTLAAAASLAGERSFDLAALRSPSSATRQPAEEHPTAHAAVAALAHGQLRGAAPPPDRPFSSLPQGPSPRAVLKGPQGDPKVGPPSASCEDFTRAQPCEPSKGSAAEPPPWDGAGPMREPEVDEGSFSSLVSSLADEVDTLPLAVMDGLSPEEVSVWINCCNGTLLLVKCTPAFMSIVGTVPAMADFTSLCLPTSRYGTAMSCQKTFEALIRGGQPPMFTVALRPANLKGHVLTMLAQAQLCDDQAQDPLAGQGGQPMLKLLLAGVKLRATKKSVGKYSAGSGERLAHLGPPSAELIPTPAKRSPDDHGEPPALAPPARAGRAGPPRAPWTPPVSL